MGYLCHEFPVLYYLILVSIVAFVLALELAAPHLTMCFEPLYPGIDQSLLAHSRILKQVDFEQSLMA